MTRNIIILMLTWFYVAGMAQIAPQKYFVEFTDRDNSPYSVTRPNEFLSSRAIDRRQRQGIPIEENDLPVNQSYINKLSEYNAVILTRSKWFNGVTIYCINPSIIDVILQLPFVKSVYKSKKINNIYHSNSDDKFMLNEVEIEEQDISLGLNAKSYFGNSGYHYGPSYNQIHMLNGDSLHKLGYTGEGMVIAVLDAGFFNVDILPAFDSLRLNNQILGAKDFVSPGNNVYKENEHGMEVLSCMGANLPGQLIGSAPKAKYWLLRTENINSEYIIEEFNWVAAAEFADSAGADIINSSLGYTVFNDAAQDHTCHDLDGNTTPVAKGANMASEKGMIVVNSAGNKGASSWKCVSTPADGFTVLSVAAVDSNSIRAGFSSVGVASGRIKPNIAAMGKGVVVASPAGTIIYNSGTSFSAPLVAGLTACLWQAMPSQINTSITRAIELSGNQAVKPDSLLGYGIPDFIKALNHVNIDKTNIINGYIIFPNPFASSFSVSFDSQNVFKYDVFMFNILGLRVFSIPGQTTRVGHNQVIFPDMSSLPDGNYILQLAGNDFNLNFKVVKTRK
jgi:serine protease AprX